MCEHRAGNAQVEGHQVMKFRDLALGDTFRVVGDLTGSRLVRLHGITKTYEYRNAKFCWGPLEEELTLIIDEDAEVELINPIPFKPERGPCHE